MDHTMATPSIEDTITFIQAAHGKQEYKPGMPYWQHPVAVMNRLPKDATHEEKLAALLHDVMEDTPFSRADLEKMGYPKRTLDIAQAVTSHKPPQMMDDNAFVAWYRGTIRALVDGTKRIGTMEQDKPELLSFDPLTHRGALRVKLADNQENRNPASLLLETPESRAWFCRKYAGVAQMLQDGLRGLEQCQTRYSGR